MPIATEVGRRGDEVGRFVVVGGDGTVREAIDGLGDARSRIPVGIVPMGNANVVARELGIGPDVDEAIRVAVDGEPVPMADHEIERIIGQIAQQEEKPTLKIDFKEGDSVKIKEGPFENFDGVVDEVIPSKGMVRVTVTIFSRPTPVELEYWQVEAI